MHTHTHTHTYIYIYTGLVKIMSTLMNYLDHTFPGRWIVPSGPLLWLPHSPDTQTPWDFWLWGMVKERLYSRKIRDINYLKDRIRNVVTFIPREMCVWVLNGTISHWLLCVKHGYEYSFLYCW
jgi:hypothetical protein